jgi:hypothetical protein
MAGKRTKQKQSPGAKSEAKASPLGFVTVSNRSYGNALKGTKVYYEGKRPPRLRDDGSIQFGKNMLEVLRKKFSGRMKWILTEKTDSIEKANRVIEVRTSLAVLGRMGSEKFERDRDVKNDIVQRRLYAVYPSYFTDPPPTPYTPGTLAKTLSSGVSKKMSSKDKEALNAFLPEYFKAEAMSSVILKASSQIESLKELAADLLKEMDTGHAESWWQSYIQGKILLIQQGYIRSIEKMNIAIGKTKFPDFSLVTHDNYLDILEIKKPDTPVLKHDAGRGNFFLDADISRAVIQLENYLDTVSRHGDAVRSYIKDEYGLELKVVRPRGIILAGDARSFSSAKQRDDFRLMSQGLKNITILTYDELHTRLNNYITVLEQFSAPDKKGYKGKLA